MRHLIRQSMFVTWRSGLLPVVATVMAALALTAVLVSGHDAKMTVSIVPGLGFVYAFVTASVIADDFSSGNAAGKVICGFRKTQVYAAQFLAMLGLNLILLGSTLAGDLLGSLFAGTTYLYSPGGYPVFALCAVFNTAAQTAIFTLISMLICRRTGGTALALTLCVCTYFGMLIFGGVIQDALNEPQTIPYAQMQGGDVVELYGPQGIAEALNENGVSVREAPNPSYIAEPRRSLYEWLVEMLPATQSDIMREYAFTATRAEAVPAWMLWVDAAVIVAATCIGGSLSFRRRDLG